MSGLALRSARSRARYEIPQTGFALKNYFRGFSSSQWLADAESHPGRPATASTTGAPTARQRSRAATSQISSLVKNRGAANAGARGKPTGGGPSANSTSGQPPKVIDVQSLPRGLGRGRGGSVFRGRGGTSRGSHSSQGNSGLRPQAPTRGNNRFSRGGGATRGRGGNSGGGRGGQTARRGRGRATNKEAGDKQAGPLGRRRDPFETMDPAEEAFDKVMRFGEPMTYKPNLNLESIRHFVPVVPTTTDGRRATVLQNLSVLGTADPIGAPQDLQQRGIAESLARSGVRFFADASGREAAEAYLSQQEQSEGSGETLQGAEESVRAVIFDRAVAGKHEKPRFAETPAQISRSWHLRSETYTMADVETFEKKLSTLIKSAPAAAKAASKAKTTRPVAAKKPEAKAEAKA